MTPRAEQPTPPTNPSNGRQHTHHSLRKTAPVKQLPDNVAPYRRTPVFDETTVPDALRRDHATKAGVWGLIHVEAGCLRYEISATGETIELTPASPPGVVEPEVRHRVTPLGPVRFSVEFHKPI